jgi:hypothetical protein
MVSALVTNLKQKLQSEAYSQERLTSGNVVPNRINQIASPQLVHRIAKGPHTWQDELARGNDFLGLAGNPRLMTAALKALLNAAEVSHCVVDDRNHGEIESWGMRAIVDC